MMIANIKHISKISSYDRSLFKDYFFKEDVCHSNSWLYMLRFTRDDEGFFGYKYLHKGSLIGIGIRKQTVYINKPLGRTDPIEIANLCEQIYEHLGYPIVLRRVNQGLCDLLLQTKRFRKIERSNLLEDDAYPETIVKPSRLFLANFELNPLASKLKKKARRFEHSYLTPTLELSLNQFGEDKITDSIFQMANGIHDKYTSYLQMVKDIFSNKENSAYVKTFVFHQSEIIHGIYIIEFFNSKTVGLYCALTSKAFPGITEWIDSVFFRKIYEIGVEDVFLGGSETKGVFEYIDKLLPICPNYQSNFLVYKR